MQTFPVMSELEDTELLLKHQNRTTKMLTTATQIQYAHRCPNTRNLGSEPKSQLITITRWDALNNHSFWLFAVIYLIPEIIP